MKKTFFIVPGFKMNFKGSSFTWLINFLKTRGFKIMKVPVEWNRSTLTKNAEDFKILFNKNKGNKNYILGFSYGAVITLLTANHLKPQKIFLCSLSSDFKEDSKYLSKGIKKYIGENRLKDMYTRSGKKLAKELSVPSVVFYGEKEGKQFPRLKFRCQETAKLARRSKLVVVKNAPHQIDFPTYAESIKKIVNQL